MCVFFLWFSLYRLSLVSVVFDFNDSLNDVIPLSPILLSVDMMRKEKSELLMNVFCVPFFSSPHKSSSVSAVFDFSPSLNDVAPVSPILLPVDVMRKEKSELLVDDFGVFFLFCLHSTN